MKYFQIKSLLIKGAVLGSLMLGSTACELDQLQDPNNPSIELVGNAKFSELQNLISGIESGMRGRLGTYFDGISVIGRDYWRFSSSDPRFTSDLLGERSATLDDNTFYTTGPYAVFYQTIKNSNLLIEAVNNTTAVEATADQKNYMLAFAKTMKAYQLLLASNMQYQNGIRTDVNNPDNLGPFRTYTEALTDIAALLEEANGNLNGTEDSFAFSLSPGFSGFSTPATFRQFNRALAARVAVYQGDYAGALTKLNNSFFSLSGDLTTGASYFFSTAGGDVTNPLFLPLNNAGEIRAAHPSFIADATAGDTRLGKAVMRSEATALGTSGLTATHDVWVFRSLEDYIPIIRNEELVLIYAEANIQTNNMSEAVTALNTIRNAAGLADYSGEMTQAALLTEMLHQRRYSLFAEGHRWVDMRRYNRLNELTIDRDGDDVWEQFPRPANEG